MKKKYIPPTIKAYHIEQRSRLLVGSFNGCSEYPQDFYIIDDGIISSDQVG